jgi:hypothetical protein
MTRRDYIAIAAIIAAEYDEGQSGSDFSLGLEWMRCRISEMLARHFEQENERFDRDVFMKAARTD